MTHEEWYTLDCHVNNPLGLHMRHCMVLSESAEKWPGHVELDYNNKSYDAKSIESLLCACVLFNSDIKLRLEYQKNLEVRPFAESLQILVERDDL